MDADTKHQITGISSTLGSLIQELLNVALTGRISAVRKREWAETLEGLAARVRRLKETD